MIQTEGCNALNNFFRKNMPLTTRPASDSEVGLGRPYTVPCVRGFRNFFYWDTCFANWGLLEMGMTEQARNNLRNMAELISRWGYVPNADVLTNRSQPPLFVRSVFDYVEATGDRSVIGELLPAMVREHDFWRVCRAAPCGLTRYGNSADAEGLREFNEDISRRLGLTEGDLAEGPEDPNLMACAESGWDFSSRFFDGMTCVAAHICPVELNAMLFDAEQKIAAFAAEAGDDGLSRSFSGYAGTRLAKMRELMYDPERKLFLDYDCRTGTRRREVRHAGSFAAAAFGAGGSAEGLTALLRVLECEHGLAVCEKSPFSERFQWDFPFMWAPVTAIAWEGLKAVGLLAAADRLRDKFCTTVERVFQKTGNLWEKYDALTGEKGVSCEYETPPMLGWTAGVYLRFRTAENKTVQPERERIEALKAAL